MIALNVAVGGSIIRYFNNKQFHGIITKIDNVGSIFVKFDGFVNIFKFSTETFDDFTTTDGHKISIRELKPKQNKETFYGDVHNVKKHLIQYIEEVLKESNSFMTINEISDGVRKRGYKFPYRPDERNTTLEISVNARLFEKINKNKSNFIKSKDQNGNNVFKIIKVD